MSAIVKPLKREIRTLSSEEIRISPGNGALASPSFPPVLYGGGQDAMAVMRSQNTHPGNVVPLSIVSMKNWVSNSPGVESKGILDRFTKYKGRFQDNRFSPGELEDKSVRCKAQLCKETGRTPGSMLSDAATECLWKSLNVGSQHDPLELTRQAEPQLR